jgi:hypothetical protein
VTVYRFDFGDAVRIVAIGFAFFAALRVGAVIVQAIWFPA